MRLDPEGRGGAADRGCDLDAHHEFDEDTPTWPRELERAPRVLVAEDDRDLRYLIVARMQRESYDVLEAGSGTEILAILTEIARARARDVLDLLVMDVRMPGASGLEIARAIRNAAWRTPILLITAFPDGELLDEASRLGAGVLAKPFSLESLSVAALAQLTAGGWPAAHAAGGGAAG